MSYILNNFEVHTDLKFIDGISTLYCIRLDFKREADPEDGKYLAYTLAKDASADAVAESLIELGNTIKRSLINGRDTDKDI